MNFELIFALTLNFSLLASLASESPTDGEIENALLPCGQVIGLIDDIPSAGEIIEGIIAEAKVIGQRLYDMGLRV